MTDKSSTPRTDAIQKYLYERYPAYLELSPAAKLAYYMEAAEFYGLECRALETALTAARAEAEAMRGDAERWREYDERKRKVIAAGQGKKILRDAAIDASISTEGKK